MASLPGVLSCLSSTLSIPKNYQYGGMAKQKGCDFVDLPFIVESKTAVTWEVLFGWRVLA